MDDKAPTREGGAHYKWWAKIHLLVLIPQLLSPRPFRRL